MEFEKLKKIIAEVLNVDEEEITMETRFSRGRKRKKSWLANFRRF